MEDIKFNVEFSLLDTSKISEDEAFAAISLNPAVTWAKFILTDDKPNANKQRIPKNEFDNLIKTGIFMPIKMAPGKILDGHEDSVPLGVIAHLKTSNDQIHGLAALWERERPEDVKLVKERYAGGLPLQLSWEVLFESKSVNEDGVTDLCGTALRAVTLVGEPAYEGRTPIIAVASANSNLEDNKLEELEQLKNRIAELEASLTSKDEEITKLTDELTPLREFKATIDAEKEKSQKLASIKAKFAEANLGKEEQYFAENEEKLLSLSPEALDFMIQEMVSFASKLAETNSSRESHLPPMPGTKTTYTNSDIVAGLKQRITKQ